MDRKLPVGLATLFLVALNLLSCQEADFDPDFGEPPALPNIQSVDPEFDFFTNTQGGSAYNTAALLIQSGSEFFIELDEFYQPIILAADTVEPERGFNYWEWNYLFAAEGDTGIVRLAGEEQTEPVHLWSMFITVDIQDGPSLENYLFMQGIVHNENQYGEWYIYDPVSSETVEGAGPNIIISWDIENEESYTVTVSINYDVLSQGQGEQVEINYTRLQDEYSFNMESYYGEYYFFILWNTATSEGYIDFGGDRQCWDSMLQDTSCQTIE